MAKRAASEGAVEGAAVVLTKGSERFLMLEVAERARAALVASHGEAAAFTFDGASCTAAEILDELHSMGLMASAKVVIVENTELLLKEIDDDEEEGKQQAAPARGVASRTKREIMTDYVAKPAQGTLLLLRTGTGKWSPGKFESSIIEGGGVVVECNPPGPAEAERWCIGRAKWHKAVLEPDAARELVANIGCELGRLDSELAKLAIAAVSRGQEKIGADAVRELVGFSRESESIFELQRYLLEADAETALRQVGQMIQVSRMTPAALMVAIVDLARKIDGAARGVAARETEAVIGARLKLWGASTGPIMNAGRRLKPAQTAALLAAAVEGDARCKSGRGEPEHIVEALVMRFAALSPRGVARAAH